eukprot:CAMPEP_0194339052 /NCGR_PEP_ID=MMETSP0171-20130528/81705_1 /TAXON_ID=218684 /ORGANISM="Corethron pennatum, Strain L29A3" /LENGTH=85 /DNA_ID=CAMNT_0039103433 /DNA_START=649 /DNA_END=906 /DNA_ORIENTATION=+
MFLIADMVVGQTTVDSTCPSSFMTNLLSSSFPPLLLAENRGSTYLAAFLSPFSVCSLLGGKRLNMALFAATKPFSDKSSKERFAK